MPKAWSAKDERQYEAIRTRCLDRKGEAKVRLCERIAAATVNKQRRTDGRAKSGTEGLDGSEMKKWRKLAKKQGWKISKTGSGHLRWVSPDGESVITPATPGKGNRSLENMKANLRRAGLDFGDRKKGTKGVTQKKTKKRTLKPRAFGGFGKAVAAGKDCPYAEDFQKLVNMTPAQIRKWSKDERSKKASWESTRKRLPDLAKLKDKPVTKWTKDDCKFARRVVGFNKRMDGMRKEHGSTEKICVSLRNWGRDAPGCKF